MRACALLVFLGVSQLAHAQDPADPGEPAAEDIITKIRFVGNKTTRREILEQEMLIKVGDPVNRDLIERSRQAIMDLGLFKSVTATVAPAERGKVLLIEVAEKYYILPIPKLNRDEDNNFSLGAELRLDNLGGLNQRLQLTYETNEADRSNRDVDTYSLEYSYPRILGTPYRVDFNLSHVVTPVDEMITGVYTSFDQNTTTAAVDVSRWFLRQGPSIGWRAGTGLAWYRKTVDAISGEPDISDARAVGIKLVVENTDVHDFLYSRAGRVYGYVGEFGMPFLGSDNDYTRHRLYYRTYIPVFDRPHSTLNMQFQLGLSSDTLLGSDTAFTLGGSTTLRGYESNSIEGNSYVLANVEYLAPLFGYNPLRGVVFFDVGNAYPSNRNIDLSDLKWSAGLGLRLKLKSFVKVDLRVDVAHAFDTGETKVVATSKETF